MRIAVVLPSRGLMFSKTAAELLENLEGFDYEIFFSHGLSIPDCFELPLQRALRGDFTHVFFVEDDMILPEETLSAMLLLDCPVVACDYPVSKVGQGTIFRNKEGQVIFSGTGCLLVKREVFNVLRAPYFRTDVRWNATNYGDFIRLSANKITNPSAEGYGLHDTNFGLKLWKAEIPISEAGIIGQRKLVKLGEPGTNEGAHQIEQWKTVKPDYLLKKFKKMPAQPTGVLVPVMTKDGEMMVRPSKARQLIKSGAASKVKKQSVSIDFNGYDL